ncbi:MAG: hypothetical protein ABFS34_11030 [Gemmatimonadota bacterium]
MMVVALLSGQALSAETQPDPERAAKYYAQAMEYLDQKDRWYDAAVLLKKAAKEMDQASEEASRTLRFAGHVFSQVKSYSRAQSALEDAGELALARGDLSEAATSFVEAAHVAVARGRRADVEDLVDRVRLITASPLLSEAEKGRLRHLVAAA